MVRSNILRDALKSLCNAQRVGKRQVILRPSSKVLIHFLSLMQKYGYLGDFTVIDDHRSGKVCVNLNGRLNKAGVIAPRFAVKFDEIEKYIISLLPSRNFGHIIITTSEGIMDHNEAQSRRIGGNIVGYFY